MAATRSARTGRNQLPQSPRMPGATIALFVVVNVSVDRTADAPGVTVSGLNAHVVPGGSVAPLHDSATGLRKLPTCGVMVTVNVAVWPADSVALAGETSIEKSVT